MSTDRRRDAATAATGAGLLAGGGLMRHAGVTSALAQRLGREPGSKDYPKVHMSALRRAGKGPKSLWLGGSAVGLAGAAGLSAGSVGLARRDVKKADRSFLGEGIAGTGEALRGRSQSVASGAPVDVRGAQLAVAGGAGLAGGGLARLALKGRTGRQKALLAPIAGAAAATGSLPLSNRAVRSRSKGQYVVTSTGVRRAKDVIQRPSSKASQVSASRGPLRAQVVPSDDRFAKADYLGRRTPASTQRAVVTASGAAPVVGPLVQARTAAAYAPPGQGTKHGVRQWAMGPAAGATAGAASAYAAARHVNRHPTGRLAAHSQKIVGAHEAATDWTKRKLRIPERDPLKPPSAVGRVKSSAARRAGRVLPAAVKTKQGKVAALAALATVKPVVGMAGGQTAISLSHRDQRRYNVSVAKLDPLGRGQTKREKAKLADTKRVNAALSVVGGAAGLGGLTVLGASKIPRIATRFPGLERKAVNLSVAGGGVGGLNALVGAKVQRREAKVLDPVKKAGRTPFLHPKAHPYDAARGMSSALANPKISSKLSGDSWQGKFAAVRKIPSGPAAPEKVKRALSGGDFGETISRLGRATRRSKFEYSSSVHPISGRILSMTRGNESSASLNGVSQQQIKRKSLAGMARLADEAKNPKVRARAAANLSGENKNIAGPTPHFVHNHPRSKGMHRSHPSAADTNALREIHSQGAQNARMSVLSHRPAGRGGKGTKLTTTRVLGSDQAAAAHISIEHHDRATQGRRAIKTLLPRSPELRRSTRAGADLGRDEARSAGGQHLSRKGGLTSYDSYMNRKTGSRSAAKESGLYTTSSLHKSAGNDQKDMIRRYGDRGPLPKGLARDEKMRAYEARVAAHGGGKVRTYQQRADAAEGSRNAALGAGTLAGAAWTGTHSAKARRVATKLGAKHPAARIRHVAEVAVGVSGTAGGASELYGEYARGRRASYANSPGGVASSALTRMRANTPGGSK